jgi:RNA polymerase sigma factor (sigma-70 family)
MTRSDRLAGASPNIRAAPRHRGEAAEEGVPAASIYKTAGMRKILFLSRSSFIARLHSSLITAAPVTVKPLPCRFTSFVYNAGHLRDRFISAPYECALRLSMPKEALSDLELVRSCSDDGAAWEEFCRRFRQPITLSILRTVRPWGEPHVQLVQDFVQETYLKLFDDHCRRLVEFANRHPDKIVFYIKTVAINVARDHFKSSRSQKRGSGHAAESLEDIDPKAESGSTGGAAAMERQILLGKIQDCLRKTTAGPCQERDRIIFWLRHLQGMTAEEISAVPGVSLSAKGVESALRRLFQVVRECVMGRLGEAF